MMAPKRKRTKAEQARHYLHGGGVLREDSDDELGVEDHPWEWIYDAVTLADADKENKTTNTGTNGFPKAARHIVGARMGQFECRVGDAVLLKASGNEAWVAIIFSFQDSEVEDDDGNLIQDKTASFMWFSSEKEIFNKAKKRDDFLPVRWTIFLHAPTSTNHVTE